MVMNYKQGVYDSGYHKQEAQNDIYQRLKRLTCDKYRQRWNKDSQ